MVGLGLTRRAWTDPASRAIEACVLRCCLSLAWCLNGREPGAHCRKDTFGTHNSKQELRLGSSAPFVPTRNVFALGYLAMDASLRLEYLGRPFHYPTTLTITGPTEGEALCAKHEIPTCSDHTGRREYI